LSLISVKGSPLAFSTKRTRWLQVDCGALYSVKAMARPSMPLFHAIMRRPAVENPATSFTAILLVIEAGRRLDCNVRSRRSSSLRQAAA
jgi:hypothetical protein